MDQKVYGKKVSTRYFQKNSVHFTDPFEYNIDKFMKTDPDLIHYTQIQQIRIDMKKLYGLTIDSEDRIYITGDKSLLILDKDGKQILKNSLEIKAKCIDSGDDNLLYLGMTDHVEVYDNRGNRKDIWSSLGNNAIITSIAVTQKNIFVADAGNRMVMRFNKTGRLLNIIGEKNIGKKIPGLLIPSPFCDIAFGPDGYLWVVNPGRHALEKFNEEGDLISYWKTGASMNIEDFCGCCNPVHMTIMNDGSFVTSEKGLPRVKIYNKRGDFISVVAGCENFLKRTTGLDLAVDSGNRIFVLDPKAVVLRVFLKNDTYR